MIHADWSGEREDTIARLAGTESVGIAGPNGITDQRPIFGHMSFLVADASGRVWVREHYGEFRNRMGPGDQVWQVFAADGVWVGRVEIPLAFTVLETYDDVVLGVHRNDMGVERPQARRVNAVGTGG